MAPAAQRAADLHGGRGSAFVRTRAGLPAADVSFHIGALFFEDHGTTEFDGHAATLGPVLVSTRSRGRVWLRSSDPRDKPRILTNTLAEREDVDSLVAGVKLARAMAASAPLAGSVVRELKPGPEIASDEDVEASVRQRVELLYHPVGTCAMGAGESAVVDPQLRVRGVERLRVIDASVMPTVTSANTNAAALMIGEKGAALLTGA
jgi:choline dehydrogenase